MKLKDYETAIKKVLLYHHADRDVAGAVSNDPTELAGKEKLAIEQGLTAIKTAIKENRDILKVFPERTDTPFTEAQKQEILEREIAERDLIRHILKIRQQFHKLFGKKNDAAIRIVTHLSDELKLHQLGGFGSAAEKDMIKTHFPELMPEVQQPKPAEPNPAKKARVFRPQEPVKKAEPQPVEAKPATPATVPAPAPKAATPAPDTTELRRELSERELERMNVKALEERLRAAGKIQ